MNNKRQIFPLVTIAIPTYNASATIQKTLQSLLSQTYPNIEIIVSDNCSTDDTVQKISQYQDKGNIVIERLPHNIGGTANAERCLYLGQGEFLAIFHADDVYDSRIIEQQVKFLQANQDCGLVFTAANFIDTAEHLVGRSKTFKELKLSATDSCKFNAVQLIKKLARYGNFLITPSAMFRRHVAVDYVKTWRAAEFGSSADLDVWLKVAAKYHIAVLAELLMSYRISENQWSYNYNNRRVEESDFLKVIDYWAAQPDIAKELTAADREFIEGSHRFDRLLCGIRAYVQDKHEQGAQLLKNVFHKTFFKRYHYKCLLLWIITFGLKCRWLRSSSLAILKYILVKKRLY